MDLRTRPAVRASMTRVKSSRSTRALLRMYAMPSPRWDTTSRSKSRTSWPRISRARAQSRSTDRTFVAAWKAPRSGSHSDTDSSRAGTSAGLASPNVPTSDPDPRVAAGGRLLIAERYGGTDANTHTGAFADKESVARGLVDGHTLRRWLQHRDPADLAGDRPGSADHGFGVQDDGRAEPQHRPGVLGRSDAGHGPAGDQGNGVRLWERRPNEPQRHTSGAAVRADRWRLLAA